MKLSDYLFHEEPGITLYCGDCRDVLPLLDASEVAGALVLTDPPYGINSVRPDGTMGGSVAAPTRRYLPVYGDDAQMDVRILMGLGQRRIVWGADHCIAGLPASGRLLVWDKRVGMASNDFADAEIAWDSGGGPCRIYRHRQVGMLHDGYGDVERCHPNQKPLAVMAWCLRLAGDGRRSAPVLDPYVGSGTTLRAAKDFGRAAIGIEIEPRYCAIAVKRLRQEVLALRDVLPTCIHHPSPGPDQTEL